MRVCRGWYERLGLRFGDEAVEREFLDWHKVRVLPTTRWALLGTSLIYTAFVFLDRSLAPHKADDLTIARLLSGLSMTAGAGLLFVDSAFVRRRWQAIMMFVALACGAGIAATYSIAPVLADGGTIVSAFGSATLFGLTVTYALTAQCLILLPYSAVVLWVHPPPGPPVWWAWLAIALLFGTLGAYVIETSRRASFREQRKSDKLLHNVLPSLIADQLRDQRVRIADEHQEVTVLFADLVGFTQLTKQMSPSELVELLDRLFLEFDRAAERHGLEKIKTIGDAYMVAGGVPISRENHIADTAAMAVEMLRIVRDFGNTDLDLRIGIHSGPVVAGVIGEKRLQYDLWGETVNTASRLESHGIAGEIHVSQAVLDGLNGQFDFESRGDIELKGVGRLETFLLRPAADAYIRPSSSTAPFSCPPTV